MKDYELTVIFKTSLTVEKRDAILKKAFETAKIKIKSQKDLGKKELAYPIKKEKVGHYLFFELQSEAPEIAAFRNQLNLEANILRYLLIVI